MKNFKSVFFNFSGCVLGMAGMAVAWWIVGIVLTEWLPKIPIIPQILSWPVSYDWYATVGVISASVFAGFGLSNFICSFSRFKYNYGTILLAIISALFFLYVIINWFATKGFSLVVLIIYGLAILTCVVSGINSAENDI